MIDRALDVASVPTADLARAARVLPARGCDAQAATQAGAG
jgi:hypothetical protein